jgi:hypothetical protein
MRIELWGWLSRSHQLHEDRSCKHGYLRLIDCKRILCHECGYFHLVDHMRIGVVSMVISASSITRGLMPRVWFSLSYRLQESMHGFSCLIDRRKIFVVKSTELRCCNHDFIFEPSVLVIVQEKVMKRKILVERRNETGWKTEMWSSDH